MANWSGGLTNHAIEFSKPRVRMHYTALCNVEMADNGVEPRTSTTLIMQTFPLPTPHVASLLVSSYVSAQLPIGEIGLHQLHWTCCVTEPIPLHIQLSSSFLFTCNWTSPKSDWAALVTLTKKGRKVSKTWWGEWIIGWRKLEHFTALMRRSLTDKRGTASCLGSPFMSHQMPNGNRLSPRQLDLISHSPRQYLYIVVLSSSFIWKSTLLPHVPTHAYTDCEISGRQPTRLYKEFPRIPNAGHSQKKTMLSWQTAMLAHVGTEWHILAHVGIQLSPPFIH